MAEQQVKTVEQLESEVDGLVMAYQVMLNADVAKETDRRGRFLGILEQLQRIEAGSPRTHEVVIQLLHTALFWLAEAKDSLDKGDGNRRIGGRNG